MNTKKILIVVALIASVCFLTYPASAESGSITVEDVVLKSYTQAGIESGTPNFSKMNVFIAGYDNLREFYILDIPDAYFVKESNATYFTIVSGGVGNGYASYSKLGHYWNWNFISNTTITSTTITLLYEEPIFNSANIVQPIRGTTEALTINKPVCIFSTAGCTNQYGVGDYYFKQNAYVATTSKINYNVTYPVQNKYVVNIQKSGTVNNKITFENSTAIQWYEGSFNAISFNSPLLNYTTGLYINLSLSSIIKKVLVNSTNVIGYVPPEEELIVDPITGVGIKVSPTSGYRGTVFNISWLRTKPTPFGYIDTIEIYESGITGWVNIISSPPDSGYSKNTFTVASYTVKFVRTYFLFGTPEVLASASFEVKPDEAEEVSYVFAPAKVAVGQLFNVTYKIGWEKTTGTTVWLRDYHWDNATNAYSTTYQPWALSGAKGVETNQSILVTKTGKHLIKLCDVILGCKASTVLEAYYNGSEITDNVSYSNITLDKYSYSYGETMLVKVMVDNLNWSGKQIVVEYYDEDEGLTQNQYYVQKQIESIPLYISDLTFSGSGNALMRLVGKDVSGSYVLATVAFTLSNVDAEGYGLAVTGGSCKGDIAQILTIVPAGETANLSISADIAKYNKNYVINGTKTISYKYPIAGTYYITLRVNNEAKRLIIKNINDCDVVDGVKDDKIYGGNTTATCDFWNNCVNGMFPGQGLNNITRLLFSLFCIIVTMFFGMVVSKGNFGVSVILGFLPYAFFTYLTLSSPCGEYMPVWVSIFIALIVGIKMKWFS